MEHLEDPIFTVKEYLIKQDDIKTDKILDNLCSRVGEVIARMHSINIIHGDLTTSNMMVNTETIFVSPFLSAYSICYLTG